jgi:hypothetical protein
MTLNFITSLWPGAQRAPASMPPDLVPADPADFPKPLPTSSTEGVRQVSTPKRKSSPLSVGDAALVRALMDAHCALTVTQLAEAMGCSVSESSKRVKAAGRLVRCKRDGRSKLVRLRQMSWPEWRDLAAEARA